MPLLERRRYPISACNAASHTTVVNTGSVKRMKSFAVAGNDRARPTLQNPTITGACPKDDAGIRPH
jgi:hypothetical protein